MRRLSLLLCLFTLLVTISAAGRGPIIRNPKVTIKSSSLEISWTTDISGDSKVKLNDQVYSNDALTTQHLVTIPGLQPDTDYHFFVSSSDGSVKSNYNNIVRTKAHNAGLAERYGSEFVEALQYNFGPQDEDRLSPQVNRVLAVHDLLSVRRGLATLAQQLKECREKIAKMQDAQAKLTAGAPTQDLPQELTGVMNETKTLMPEITSDDLANMMLMENSRTIQQLKAIEQECLAQQTQMKVAENNISHKLAINSK